MTISLRTYFVIQVKRRMYRVCFRKHLSRYIPKIYLSPLLLQLLIFLYTYTACTCRVYFIKHLSCYLYIWHVQSPCKIIFVHQHTLWQTCLFSKSITRNMHLTSNVVLTSWNILTQSSLEFDSYYWITNW